MVRGSSHVRRAVSVVPRKPARPCSYPCCPALTHERFCPEHAKEDDQAYRRFQRDPEINKRYNHAWRKLRNRYIAAHPLCEHCLKNGRYVAAQEVDHITPLAAGGTHAEANLQALCKPCHSAKTAREDGRWGKQGTVYTY